MNLTSRVLTGTNENIDLFNNFINGHEKGHVLQNWEWGMVKEPAWTPIRLVVEDSDSNEVKAAVLILKRELPMGVGNIFYSPRGPVLDINDEAVWDKLVKAVAEQAKEHKAMYWKIDPDIDKDFPVAEVWRKRLQDANFQNTDKGEGFEGIQPKHVFRMDISNDIDTLLSECHSKTRYNIRLAKRKGVEIIRCAGKEYLPEFYRILTTTSDRDKFLIRNYAYFEKFFDSLNPKGQTELFMGYYNGEAIAGTLAFKIGDKAWYIYGASSNKHRSVMPNYLIQWEMISWAKEQGCTMYDFRGVPGDVPEDHPLYGLVKFKRGFGGKYTEFIGEYDLVYNKARYNMYNFLEPIYQKNIRRLIAVKKKITGKR